MGVQNEPQLPKFPYIYRATVVKIESSGKVRIKVYGLHDGIPKDVAPIAEPALDIFGAGEGAGMASVPGVGTDVWVFLMGEKSTHRFILQRQQQKLNLQHLLQIHQQRFYFLLENA